MENESKKPRIQIRLGGLVILIILALILFKVDIKGKIESEQFQKNLSYITSKAKGFWEKYITEPLKSKTGEFVKDLANQGFEKIQKSVDEKAENLFDVKSFKNGLNEITEEEEE
jgi:hypothetical protein